MRKTIALLLVCSMLACTSSAGTLGPAVSGTESAQRGRLGGGIGQADAESELNAPEGDYWLGVDLPEVSTQRRREYCQMSRSEWQRYFREQDDKARELSDQLGATGLVVEHRIGCLKTVADEVVFLHEGRVLVHEPTESFFRPTHPRLIQFLGDRTD